MRCVFIILLLVMLTACSGAGETILGQSDATDASGHGEIAPPSDQTVLDLSGSTPDGLEEWRGSNDARSDTI
jgi:hypothetical protein